MPYVPMTGLELPGDEKAVWRYMDMSKYLSLLVTRSIYFVRCDKFRDPWDSMLPVRWQEAMSRASYLPRPHGGTYTDAEWYAEREIPSNPVSCWNVGAHESERMWAAYTVGDEAVAVRSTIGRLKAAFIEGTPSVRIGLVRYGEHDRIEDPKFAEAWWPEVEPVPRRLNPWYVPRFLKRQEFDFESEVRATIHVPTPIEHGFPLEVGLAGLRTLIQCVRVKPGAPEWFVRVLESVNERYGLGSTAVEYSELGGARSR
jgi:hypothetical protein